MRVISTVGRSYSLKNKYKYKYKKRGFLMTAKEAAFYLGIKESTLKKQFSRTQQNLKKKGIILMRWGRGKKAEYEIEYEEYLLEEEEE